QTRQVALPGTWVAQGCFTDISFARTLLGSSTAGPDMTIETCLAFCDTGGFGFAGVEFGSECYCDHAPQASGLPVELSECNVPCAGDATEFCGAGNRLNLFWDGSALPTITPAVDTWQYQGCFADSINPRTLPNNIATADGKVTAESCTTACLVNGFSVAGMEFGLECWCANALPTAVALGDDQCRMACVAEPTEFCGGFSRIQVYLNTPPAAPTSDTPLPPTETAPTSNTSLPPTRHDLPGTWVAQGCFTDISFARTLLGSSTAGPDMTIETCLAFCDTGGFGFAGVEFGSECYCDHAPQASGLPVELSECNVPCAGDATEFCGAGNRLNLFWDGSALPTITPTVDTWQYQGCFADSINPRTLPNNIATADGKVTAESCTTACLVNGFSVAGMEFGLECWCANALPTALALGDDQCRMACVAEPTEFCGGFSRIQVY
ncbi:WSC domain-containing protein, partial [Mycena rebaudengoi]